MQVEIFKLLSLAPETTARTSEWQRMIQVTKNPNESTFVKEERDWGKEARKGKVSIRDARDSSQLEKKLLAVQFCCFSQWSLFFPPIPLHVSERSSANSTTSAKGPKRAFPIDFNLLISYRRKERRG
jgi:hypothetical protein